MKSASNQKSKVPAVVHDFLKSVIPLIENSSSIYISTDITGQNLSLSFTGKEFSEFLSFVQSVSAGEV